MHELGLVNYVVKEVSKVAEENNVSRIKSVTLEFGEVSGIVIAEAEIHGCFAAMRCGSSR